ADAAGHDSIAQGFRSGSRGQHKWLITVGLLERFEPPSPVERRSTRMAGNQVVPTRIGKWIDDVQKFCLSCSGIKNRAFGSANPEDLISRIIGCAGAGASGNLESIGHPYLNVAGAPTTAGAAASACSTASQSAC